MDDANLKSQMPSRGDALREATDCLTCLAEVFGWLNTLLVHIEEQVHREASEPRFLLARIDDLIGPARYLSEYWRGEAESVAGRFQQELNGEVCHA
ncbi:hypothetical protein [Paraburkholderia saeva]|uniref:hypothetical protein n=1 Tax=Paraburkholderia saeva TaxID=2777537 RepID=UPI001DBBF234|nr:hypothetical protein [Paraburkholderia saeva]CAG4908340.1 hypothetical protein R52603_03618 [Paraburkholderia saeva]